MPTNHYICRCTIYPNSTMRVDIYDTLLTVLSPRWTATFSCENPKPLWQAYILPKSDEPLRVRTKEERYQEVHESTVPAAARQAAKQAVHRARTCIDHTLTILAQEN